MADKEKLSALMDGEMIDKALIAELEVDQESLQTWKNYHLIGDVMRGEAPERAEWNIAERVALALENEPAHNPNVIHSLNHTGQTDQKRIDNSTVTHVDFSRLDDQPTPQQSRRRIPTWLNQFGQVAVAACVSLAVIVGVQQYSGESESTAQDGQLPVLQTVPFSGSAEPVSLTRESFDKQHSSDVNVQEQRRRINAMLQDYELQLRLNSENNAISYSDSAESEVK